MRSKRHTLFVFNKSIYSRLLKSGPQGTTDNIVLNVWNTAQKDFSFFQLRSARSDRCLLHLHEVAYSQFARLSVCTKSSAGLLIHNRLLGEMRHHYSQLRHKHTVAKLCNKINPCLWTSFTPKNNAKSNFYFVKHF